MQKEEDTFSELLDFHLKTSAFCHYKLYQLMPIGQQVHCHVPCTSATTCLHLCISI